MSASRKTTSKPATSPAPATKVASAKTVAKIKPSPAKVQVITPTPVAMLAPSPAPVPAPAVAAPAPVQSAASEPVVTTITAKIDVGFGNALFIRGEGAGLSWDKGVPMDCVDNDLWRIVLAESSRAYTFKFLLNDETWSTGPDFTAACGTSVTLTPDF